MIEKRALIIGCNGFVGGYLKEELCKNGYVVFGCDCNVAEKPWGFGFIKADITDADAVMKTISEVHPDYIFNLAAISSVGLSWKIPQETINVNVCGTLNILEAVRRGAPVRVILVGSSEEFAPSHKRVSEQDMLEAVNPYGISRIMIENFAKIYRNQYGLDIVCIRAFNHTGVGQKPIFVLPSFIEQVVRLASSGETGAIKVGNISVSRDFSDVRDIVRAYRLLAECPCAPDVVNVGSGIAYKIEDLLHYIISLSGKEIAVAFDRDRFRPDDLPYCCCDNALLKRLTGWEPQFTIFDTLKEMYDNAVTKRGTI